MRWLFDLLFGTPLRNFFTMFVFSLGMTAYYIRVLIRTGFSAFMLFFVLLFVAGTVVFALELKRFRLTPGGLAIQHLLTRRTRVIPYPAIEQLFKDHQRKTRNSPEEQQIKIRYEGRVETMRFFDRDKRDEVYRRLEGCRQGDIEANVGRAELPKAQLLASGEGWIYPWRRQPRQQSQQQDEERT